MSTEIKMKIWLEQEEFTLEMISVMYDEYHELLEYVDRQAWLKDCKEAQKLHNKLQLPGTTRWFITDGKEYKNLKEITK